MAKPSLTIALIISSKFLMGCLWDITDKDADKFTQELLGIINRHTLTAEKDKVTANLDLQTCVRIAKR